MKILRLWPLLALFVSAHASAGHMTPRMRECFDGAAEYHHVNPVILRAITRVEPGYNPSAINRNGNGSYDIGLMQINSSWFPRLREFGVTPASLTDPCTSIYIGAWVLAQSIVQRGNTWQAIGAYNSATPGLNERYAVKVYRVVLHQGRLSD